ncbi:MAG: ABC transporter permease subunit [Actinomycetes bacterium]|jgi:ABC-type proline/glycine betaine transport system permease subunit|nr:ABC transporter permease subunit [Acidimicrobiia bacterium]
MRDLLVGQASFPSLDIGGWIAELVAFLGDNLGFLFRFIRTVVGSLADWIETALTAPPDWVMVAVLTLVALLARGWRFALFTAAAFSLIGSMGRFEETMDTLALVLVAVLISVAIGTPLGVLAARSDRFSSLIRPALDFMQTMPAFIYLLLAVVFFRIGVVPGVMASVIFAMPPAVRLTELGIRQVDREVVEAAEAFGARPREVLFGVQLPLARPSIMAGVNQVIMLTLSMVVIAGMAGAGGLGETVVSGVMRLNVGLGVEGGLAVVILAIFLDRVTAVFGTRRRRTGRRQLAADQESRTLAGLRSVFRVGLGGRPQ